MWSMLSQDFSDFAKAFKSESAGFVDYLGHMASDVVGRGDVYAGDEVMKKTTQSMPLPNELLRRLQEAESTYSLPIQPEERAAFAEWLKVNPLSSLNAQRRHTEAVGKSPQSKSVSAVTPNRRSTEWPDEPIDETRQRLLDYNDVVLQRYMTLVGDAVSPRSSIPASPATPDTRRRLIDPPSAVKFDGGDETAVTAPAADKSGEEEGEGKGSTAGGEAKPPLAPPSSSASASPIKACGTITEDDFFDRYFFRLTQLRVTEAQHCRNRVAADAAADLSDVSPVLESAQRWGKVAESTTSSMKASLQQSHSSPTNANDTSRRSNTDGEDNDFVAVPLFAKRMMNAASGFVTNIDNALNSVVAAETSRCSGDGLGFRNVNSEDESANVDPSDLVYFHGAKQQIADLESLVHELQETLRHERHRVQQLTSVLKAHDIEVPAEMPFSSSNSPAKSVGASTAAAPLATATPGRHADVTPVSTSPAAIATDSKEDVAVATLTETSKVETSHTCIARVSPGVDTAPLAAAAKVDVACSSHTDAEKASGVVSAGSEDEEDDEAWVNVNPSSEQTAQ